MFASIRNNLNYIIHSRKKFLFGEDFNNLILTIFFEDSCSLLNKNYNYSMTECASTTKGYTIDNPFEIGLAFYFQRQNYFLFTNYTEN
jgi:hypothetical protein